MIKFELVPSKPAGILGHMRSFIARGALFLLPIAVTVFIANFALGIVDDYLGGPTQALVRWLVPASWLGLFPNGHVPGLSMVVLVVIMLAVGAVASWKVGNQGLRLFDVIALRIPVFGGIYASTRKIVDSFGQSDRFQRVVFLKIFGGGLQGLAFVTAETVDEKTGQKWLWVFYPHIPNPTSGLLMCVPESETVTTNITPQEGFKLLMSLGTLMPRNMQITGPTPPSAGSL